MKGACPDCGFQGELLAFLVDVEARQAIGEALRVPAELAPLVIRYLGLFRPSEKTLSLNKAARLLRELSGFIEAGKVERRGRILSPPPFAWRDALNSMLDARDRLTLPLKNHNYLIEIVAGLADKEEAAAETKVEKQRQRGSHRETTAASASSLPVSTTPVLAREILNKIQSGLKGPSSGA
ncbi:MAG: hypothetical protein HYX63_13485 [Gammaproteobacteria bacterium]|nr:hypothetical protein [Gammaproteobacteria bacterium]